jgi:hypothetical protein
MRTTAALTAGAIGAAILLGCLPSLDDPDRFQTTCPADFSVEAMLRDTCAKATCHVAGATAAAGLDLASSDAFSRMYGVTSSMCGEEIISPLGPDHSLLVEKLAGTTTCGARMPLGGAPLSASEMACVRDWITGEIAASPPLPDGGTDDAGDPDAGAP